MKRDQYKLLAEKYETIQENDKEDIMAGLEQLANMPQIIYGITIEICRHEYDRGPTLEWNPEEINDSYFNEEAKEYYADFTSDLPEYDFDMFMEKIKTGEIITLTGEEAGTVFCINRQALENFINSWEQEHGYANNGEDDEA